MFDIEDLKTDRLSPIKVIISLRSIAIIVQILALSIVTSLFDYHLALNHLILVIFIEFVFNVGSFLVYRNKPAVADNQILFQLIFDVVILGFLLYFSGGATNAFVSLLLIPIAVSALSLPLISALIVMVLAIATYSFLLWFVPMEHHHGSMEGHYTGMWVNFIFSGLVVVVIISYMLKAIRIKDAELARYREEQLAQENIISLGIASAQASHDIATPIGTLKFLVEELKESETIDNSLVTQIDSLVDRCSDKLSAFRQRAEEITSDLKQDTSCFVIMETIRKQCLLYYPNIDFNVNVSNLSQNELVTIDNSFFPAVLNIVNNSVNASLKADSNQVALCFTNKDNSLLISIIDQGNGFDRATMNKVGKELVKSQTGLGMALLLSNRSIENLGGSIEISNNVEQGATVKIVLPTVKPQ